MAGEGGAPGGWLLAIDSSTDEAGIALSDGRRIAEINWTANRDQTVTVLDQIDRLMSMMQIEPAALAAVAVATGPGMFNGLRVAMSIAKGFVIGLGVPLVGVSTLEATALPYAVVGLPMIPVVAAGRERLVWAVYEPSAGGSNQVERPRNGTILELASRVNAFDGGVIVCGDLSETHAEILASKPTVRLPADGVRNRRAAALLALARARRSRGEADDAVTLEPLYLHAAKRPT
ncbi:MAG: tRNA (adenosine(37)-N6)-threonylcarbamoyltransferase complex dimerization subunit type 1 TsaB [Thermomicrobiales bacterium]